MRRLLDANRLVAAALFVITLGVYAATVSHTISFWDCGEFVATAFGLGIPHQPGTPLYVLVGRVFSLLPLGLAVAHKINLMSAFFAALAVMVTYLATVRLQINWAEEKQDPTPLWLVRVGAAVGAGFLAFSTTFWNNAIEAEVYALAAFVLSSTAYMAVRWYETRTHEGSSGLMLIIIYVMGLSVGFHLGSILVYPGIFVLAVLCRDKVLKTLDIFIVSMVMGTFVLSTMVSWDVIIGLLYVIAIALALWRLVSPGGSGFAMAGIALFLLGLSVHLFMLVRTTQEPFINQSVPDTFDRLMSVIRREQYPPRVPWHREAPLLWQFGHFWGSSFWQEGTSMAGSRVVGLREQFTFLPRPNFLDVFLPTGLWLYGLVNQFRGDRRLFGGFFTILLINSLGLLLMLNFTDIEVRERDYFYFGAFQFCAVFLGLGAGGVLRALWLGWRNHRASRTITVAGSAILLLVAFLPILVPGHPKYFEHDRKGDVIARNYGYNMLVDLPESAVLFTNGDNDTFPLWYLQDVEGVRQDVRVINLSLINLSWYIHQLKDVEPKVPIAWNARQIDGKEDIDYRGIRTPLVPRMTADNQLIWVRDMAVWHIIQTNQWKRPIYFAVTIPTEYIEDYMPYCSMEGLVYKLTPSRNPDNVPFVDSDAIIRNMTETYDLTGVVTADWKPDLSVYRDHNTAHLLRNYPAALCRVGYRELLADNNEKALRALELAYAIDPTFAYVVDFLPVAYLRNQQPEQALERAGEYLHLLPDPRQMAIDMGENLIRVGDLERSIQWAQRVLEYDPTEPAFNRLYVRALWAAGRFDEAIDALQRYVDESRDPSAAAELDTMRQLLLDRSRDSLIPEGLLEGSSLPQGAGP